MKAAVHLGQNYIQNLVTFKNINFEELKTMFDISQKFILNQDIEILNVSTIEWIFSSSVRSTFLHDKVIKWTKAKVHVYSTSVLCLGKMQGQTEANVKWKGQLQDFRQSNGYRESFGIGGEPIEFEWSIFHGLTTLQILWKIHVKLEACQTDPEEFEDRIIFMSMFQRYWLNKENSTECFSNSEKVKNYAVRFPLGNWSFLRPRKRREMTWNAHLLTWRTVKYDWCHGGKFQRNCTFNIPRYQCAESRILQKGRWNMYDSLHCRVFECRAFRKIHFEISSVSTEQ